MKSGVTQQQTTAESSCDLIEQATQTTDVLMPLDAAFDLEPSADNMQLFLSIQPSLAGGRDVTAEDIIAELKHRDIIHGVNDGAIREAVAAAAKQQPVVKAIIVVGREHVEARPERFKLYTRRSMEAELVRTDSSQTATDETTRSTRLCLQGDIILKRIPAVPGKQGYNAVGKLVDPQPPTPVNITIGPNVTVEGQHYIAQVPGVVLFEANRLEVRRLMIIEKDITANRPAVVFDGDLHIRSCVRSGSKVTATGNITVDGGVEAATITSTQGHIALNQGVTGQGEGVIQAEGDVTARFAENVTIFAGGHIHVSMGALHSRLIAGAAIHITQGRGQMIGGSALAGELIEVKQVGSGSGVGTELCVGLSRQVMHQLGKLDEQQAQLRIKWDQATAMADQIQRTIGDPAKLPEKERNAYTMLRRVQTMCDAKIRFLHDEREKLMAESACQTEGKIDVHQVMMQKVLLRIGDAELLNGDQRPRCRAVYKPDDKSIDFVPLR